MDIFNRNIIKINREKLQHDEYVNHPLIQYAIRVLKDQLSSVNLSSNSKVLIYGVRSSKHLAELQSYFNKNVALRTDFYDENASTNLLKYDLIISFLDLGSINNINHFLLNIKFLLKDDGAFLGCFFGASTLSETRRKLLQMESSIQGKYVQRIWPMIKPEDIAKLLQLAEFRNIISFTDVLKVRYATVYDAVLDIKKFGESGSLAKQHFLPKSLYEKLKSQKREEYNENYEIVSFYAANSAKLFASNC